MSATSASSASRRRARSSTSSPSAARATSSASIGEIIGPGFSSDEVVDAVETLVDTYLEGPRRAATRTSSPPIAGSARRRSRRRSMAPLDALAAARSTPDAARRSRRGRARSTRATASATRTTRSRSPSTSCSPAGSRWSRASAPNSAVLLHIARRGRPRRAGHLPRHRPALRRDARVPRRGSPSASA